MVVTPDRGADTLTQRRADPECCPCDDSWREADGVLTDLNRDGEHLPPTVSAARMFAVGYEDRPIAAERIGVAATAEPAAQGESFLFRLNSTAFGHRTCRRGHRQRVDEQRCPGQHACGRQTTGRQHRRRAVLQGIWRYGWPAARRAADTGLWRADRICDMRISRPAACCASRTSTHVEQRNHRR